AAERIAHLAREQFRLDALRALEPPGGAGDAAGEQALQRTLRREVVDQLRFERGERLCALARDHRELLGAKAVAQRIARRARLAFGGLRAARFGAVAAAG